MIVTTDQLFKAAYGKFAVGAYNINNMEQALGLFEGHAKAQAPFIVQLSKGARNYANPKMIEGIIRAAEEIYPDLIFAVHLDHGDEQTCYDCIDSGFYSSVMIDASHESFEKNVEITKRVVERAHAKGISVESELGMLGGVEEDIQVDEKHAMLTDPLEAKKFVELTGCDSLAVAIGTSHGAYKFSGKQGLHFDRIEEIQRQTENLFQEYRQYAQEHDFNDIDFVLEYGSPKVYISKNIPKDYQIDLIMMGATGLNAVERLFIGSVSEYVIRNASSGVLTDWRKTYGLPSS